MVMILNNGDDDGDRDGCGESAMEMVAAMKMVAVMDMVAMEIVVLKRIFKKRNKKKAKSKQIKARNGKDKVKRDHSANFPKKQSFPPNKPRYNLDVLPYFFPAKPLDTLAKIISSTLLFPPSCIKSMLAIPHLSQVSSMAEIDPKEAQKKSKAGICFKTYLTQQAHLVFALTKEAQAASPKR
ncbi:hypothetical protein Tco_0213551 [Tanacetum coccineum]